MQVCICVYSHDVHGDGGGQALTDVFEEVIRGEEVGAPRDQVLLELQQLSPPAQKHLTHTYTHTQILQTVYNRQLRLDLWHKTFFLLYQ